MIKIAHFEQIHSFECALLIKRAFFMFKIVDHGGFFNIIAPGMNIASPISAIKIKKGGAK